MDHFQGIANELNEEEMDYSALYKVARSAYEEEGRIYSHQPTMLCTIYIIIFKKNILTTFGKKFLSLAYKDSKF